MIDIHTHVLPGLDDGAKTLEDSIEMCRMSYMDGVEAIVATPHTLNGIYLNDRDTILRKVQELNTAIRKFGVGSSPACRTGREFGVNSKTLRPKDSLDAKNNTDQINQIDQIDKIDLKILPGSDVHLCEKTLPHLDRGKVMTLGDGGKYLFLEFPSQGIPYQAGEIIFQIMARGIIPIITHPERNMEVVQRPRRYYEMIRMGCLGQVTAMSLTGEFGSRVRQVAEDLLTHRLIHFIASDAHSSDGRPPVLSKAVRAAERLIGKEEAQRMVTEYPQTILEGLKLHVAEPIPPR